MRFASFFSIALAAATASVAVAHPAYDSMLSTRAEDDLSLSAREPAILDLLDREYLGDADFGLSRRGDIDAADLLRREYLTAALFARGGGQDSKQPLKSAMKGGRGSHVVSPQRQKVAFDDHALVHHYNPSQRVNNHRGLEQLKRT
ncbi:hypothetical protein DAEQUDRAFT_725066 [Daedalea quercina L-15889]|uniref:Uncharacterized protein n=1 Tax=Daedalea quercina L-15889 TaxID=1314783 RepID=A0A165RBV3_9APHY|nr:hypothetical protein DAEQUDRAFT_725066 [Daedalea quercina L-15889]